MRITMASLLVSVLGTGAGCATNPAPVTVDPGEAGDGNNGKADGASSIPDVRCGDAPDAGDTVSFNHLSSKVIAALGDPHHRGIDLIAAASAGTQAIAGEISYGPTDKALEDENVDLFACRDNAWTALGSATTDDEGRFELDLSDDARLPIGMRDLYVSVAGDRTGVYFLGYVAPDGSALAISDVDGTLTTSEDVFFETITLGIEVDIWPSAADTFTAIANLGYQPVYVTARARRYTEDTRQWLADKGMPRGPLRLADGITLPGSDSAQFKIDTFAALDPNLVVGLGNGNRASDIQAYQTTSLTPDRIFVKLPEFMSELQPYLDSNQAVGVSDYADFPVASLPPQ